MVPSALDLFPWVIKERDSKGRVISFRDGEMYVVLRRSHDGQLTDIYYHSKGKIVHERILFDPDNQTLHIRRLPDEIPAN